MDDIVFLAESGRRPQCQNRNPHVGLKNENCLETIYKRNSISRFPFPEVLILFIFAKSKYTELYFQIAVEATH